MSRDLQRFKNKEEEDKEVKSGQWGIWITRGNGESYCNAKLFNAFEDDSDLLNNERVSGEV